MRCMTLGAMMLVDVVATLGGAATITLGGAAVSTLGDAVSGGVVVSRPAMMSVNWQIAHMCLNLTLAKGGTVCPSCSRRLAAACSVWLCLEAMGTWQWVDRGAMCPRNGTVLWPGYKNGGIGSDLMPVQHSNHWWCAAPMMHGWRGRRRQVPSC